MAKLWPPSFGESGPGSRLSTKQMVNLWYQRQDNANVFFYEVPSFSSTSYGQYFSHIISYTVSNGVISFFSDTIFVFVLKQPICLAWDQGIFVHFSTIWVDLEDNFGLLIGPESQDKYGWISIFFEQWRGVELFADPWWPLTHVNEA